MCVLMVLGFLVAWTPYASFTGWIFMNKGAAFHPLTAALCAFFAKSSALYNPVIYVLMNKQVGICKKWSHLESKVFTPFVLFTAIVLISLIIRICFFSSSVTACSALLEWAAWWRMRPQCLPARQKSPLCPKHRRLVPRKKCLKWRDIFLRLDTFLFTASFIWNNP